MKLPVLAILAAAVVTVPAYADFSYKVTRKMTGMMAQPPSTSTYYYKDQKMKFEDGNTASILDFGARTITTINNAAKTVTVRSFDDIGKKGASDATATVDVKETGQKKTVNGFSASELVLTIQVDMPAGRQGMGKMQMEMDMWLASDVPGAEEMYKFHERNAANFPWAAMSGGGGNPGMASAMADLQRKIASMHGVPVEEVIKINPAGGAGMPQMPAMPQMSGAQQAQMDQARARLEAMAAQGGPAAAAAQQALARMGGMQGMQAGGGAGGAMMQITMDSSDFSGASIPESVFAVPADYKKN
jgi:hypothetical protein